MRSGRFRESSRYLHFISPHMKTLIFGIAMVMLTKPSVGSFAIPNHSEDFNVTGNIAEEQRDKHFTYPELKSDYFEGDIIPDTYRTVGRNALRNETQLWPGAIVLYKIDEAFEEKYVEQIKKAMAAFSKVSCVRFIPAPENSTAFVHIISHWDSCTSNLGYLGKEQFIKLKKDEFLEGCFEVGEIMHQLMHTLGFTHQHNVPGRNRYIQVLFQNIKKEYRHFFQITPSELVRNFKLPYDFESVTHFNAYQYSDRGLTTISPKVDIGDALMGQRFGLSELDIKKVNLLYNCCN